MSSLFKRMDNQSALTLTELLVSSILMGIVMVGAAGYSATIKRMYDTSDKQTILAMQAASAVATIERDAERSIGFKDTTNAIVSYQNGVVAAVPARTYWSFRTDPANTPDVYTDDVWMIIYQLNSAQFDLLACSQPEGVGPGLGAVPDPTTAACGANRIRMLVNRVQAFTLNRVINATPSAAGLDMYVDVDLTVSQDPTSTGDDPFDDPAFRITTRIPMTSHSWN